MNFKNINLLGLGNSSKYLIIPKFQFLSNTIESYGHSKTLCLRSLLGLNLNLITIFITTIIVFFIILFITLEFN